MDVHVPRAVVTGLRLRGINVLTAQEDGSARLDDNALLERATRLGRVLVSHDKDLLREAAHRLAAGDQFSEATSPDEWAGRLQYLPLG